MACLIYALLTTFVNNKNSNIMDGKLLYTIVLSALPEFVVVFVFLLTGFTIPSLATYQQRSLLIRQAKTTTSGIVFQKNSSHSTATSMAPSRGNSTTMHGPEDYRANIGILRMERETGPCM
ncbi:uncharacterized protein A1O5_05026 [Cladophialophora psammophila CBS 110553]|uniref:DUF7702 domain-containing protein n=1 Tax=Cladophialophora psammophila CBS 110553 TaxID=1182543 RepID=W9X1L0_9EURO|nr:uncharacterized protein A1O5_05026 [Cladophialophora psammophila CBS 110553]EXJ71220.1 hypothetical protein A1O5_05026 [Cladophialophora psammophila CBS 110553]